MTILITEEKTWTILSLIDWGSRFLMEKGFDDARLNSELLLCHLLNYSRIDLYLKYDQMLTMDELARFKELFKRRLSHEPIQYIIGETEFMGLRLKVDQRVFIPRLETEVLVENIIRCSKDNLSVKCVLDIGTGSGNIAVSIAKFIEHCTIDAVDVSTEALEIAQQNIQHHHLEDRITLINANFLKGQMEYPHSRYDLIVSNPPYISQKEFSMLQPEVKDFEPDFANTDFADGLTFFQTIAQNGRKLLCHGGLVFVEMAYNQSEQVQNIFQQNNYCDIEVILDYSGIERVVKARWG